MFTIFKIFETWNDDRIDKSLFVSGRAKHNPKVRKNIIEYKTDDGKYVAKIKQLGVGKFLCKVYKIKNDGSRIRIKRKYKDTLRTAHNFVREVLNDKLENKKVKRMKTQDIDKQKDEDPIDKLFVDKESDFSDSSFNFTEPEIPRKTIIRRFS